MLKRLTALCAVAALAWAAQGCATQRQPAVETAPAAEAAAPQVSAPEFEATLWDGRELEGPLGWNESGVVTVGETAIAKSDIKLIEASTGAGGPAGVDLSALPEGFRPLSDNELVEYRKRALAAADKNKGSDTVLCLDLGEDVYREDGTQLYRYHALVLILKESGRGAANISVGYNEGRSRSKVLFARSISPEGVSEWSDETTFTASTPPQAAQFVDTRARVISGQAPGAGVDMLVEYAYEYELYKPEMKDFFFPGYIFQGDKPVLDSIFEVLVPEGKPLNCTSRNMPSGTAQPRRSKRGGSDVYRWEVKDAPVITAEPFMPPMDDIRAQVRCSLYFDWKVLMAPTKRFQSERIQVTPEIRQLADRLTEGRTTDDEKVAAVYHWVERNINYLSIKASLSSGWAGHPAAETLEAGYGDCTDVANLTSALCRAAGVDAYPAIINTNDAGEMVTDIPVPDANHAIVLVYPDGEPRFIDPTATNFRYPYFRSDDHGVKAVIYIKEEITEVPVPPPQDNLRESRQEITLDANGGAEAVESNRYTGNYEAGVRGFWLTVPPEMRARIMQQSLQSRSPGSVVEKFDPGDLENLDEQLKMEIRYRAPALATRIKDLYVFSLPNFKQEFPETALEEREFDVVLPTTQEYDTIVTVRIPEGFRVTGSPPPLVVHGKHLWFDGSVEVSEDGSTVTARQVYRRLTRRVPVAEYAGYRKNAAAIATWTDLRIVLENETAAGREAAK